MPLVGHAGVQRRDPGGAQNAIDWALHPYGDHVWDGKPAAAMGASVGTLGTACAQDHLRPVFGFSNMHAPNRPGVMISHAAQRCEAQGHLADTTTQG